MEKGVVKVGYFVCYEFLVSVDGVFCFIDFCYGDG